MVGRNDILTAALVVYHPGKTSVDIDVYPAYDGAAGPWGSFTSGAWKADYYKVGNADNTISHEDSAWDVAVVGLSSPLGDKTGWYGMHSQQGSGTYEVMGYPSAQGTQLTADTGYAKFESGTYDISQIYHSFGSSGGPILNANHEVVGVVSSTAWGDRLDDEWGTVQQWIAGNDYLMT